MTTDVNPAVGGSPVETIAPVDVAALNDRLAREHDINDYYEKSPRVIRWIEQTRLRVIREMVAEDPGQRILEIGSGGGHVLRMFKRARLVAVDVSEVFLNQARANLVGYDATFIRGDITTLDLPAASFDRVICTEVLEHTTNPDEILAALARLLAPSGRAVITVPNDPLIDGLKGLIRKTPARLLFGGKINWGGDEFHLHKWRPHEFRALLERHFLVEEERAVPHAALPIRVCFLCRKKDAPAPGRFGEPRPLIPPPVRGSHP